MKPVILPGPHRGLKIGLFGGSFDPAHSGHRHLADTAMKRLGLDWVWWLPANGNPLKEKSGGYHSRFASAQRLAKHPRMRVSNLEKQFKTRYTVITLKRLIERAPNAQFVWLMGADNLGSFPRWVSWQEIAKTVPIAVIARPGDARRARLGKFARTFARQRLPENAAGYLTQNRAPAWVYLKAPLDATTSTALRQKANIDSLAFKRKTIMAAKSNANARGALAYLIETEMAEADFRADVLAGLSAERPFIPPKYFYDERGAALFEDICETPEYYVTRAEHALLSEIAPDIARIIGPDANLIEPGSGAATKIRILIRAMQKPAECVLFDISREQLESVAADLANEFPGLRVGAIAGDFTAPIPMTDDMFSGAGKRVCFFPGGTLGNFSPTGQIDLLNGFQEILRPGDHILLGVDAIKNTARLDAAYNDSMGLTAEFNLNLLNRIQNEPEGKLDSEAWRHVSFFDPQRGCIEMHLQATSETVIEFSGRRFEFSSGDTIKTEESWKFDEARLKTLAKSVSMSLENVWTNENNDFLAALLTKT